MSSPIRCPVSIQQQAFDLPVGRVQCNLVIVQALQDVAGGVGVRIQHDSWTRNPGRENPGRCGWAAGGTAPDGGCGLSNGDRVSGGGTTDGAGRQPACAFHAASISIRDGCGRGHLQSRKRGGELSFPSTTASASSSRRTAEWKSTTRWKKRRLAVRAPAGMPPWTWTRTTLKPMPTALGSAMVRTAATCRPPKGGVRPAWLRGPVSPLGHRPLSEWMNQGRNDRHHHLDIAVQGLCAGFGQSGPCIAKGLPEGRAMPGPTPPCGRGGTRRSWLRTPMPPAMSVRGATTGRPFWSPHRPVNLLAVRTKQKVDPSPPGLESQERATGLLSTESELPKSTTN